MLNRLHYSTVVLASFGFGLFLPFLKEDLGLSYLQIGLLQAVAWGTSAVCLVPFSVLLARFNPNRRVLVGLALMTPFLFTQGLAGGFWTLLASRFLMVLTQAGMTPARPLLLRWWVAPRQYSNVTAVGLSLHSTFMAAALTFSPVIIVVLNSWRLAYFLQAALMAGHFLLWAGLTRKAPPSLEETADSTARDSLDLRIDQNSEPDGSNHIVAQCPHPVPARLAARRSDALPLSVLDHCPDLPAHHFGNRTGSRHIRRQPVVRVFVLRPHPRRDARQLDFQSHLQPSFDGHVAGFAQLGVHLGRVDVWERNLGRGGPYRHGTGVGLRPGDGDTTLRVQEHPDPRGIRSRRAGCKRLGAIGFGGGPVLAGALAETTGSLVTGVLVVGGLTGMAVLAAAALPRRFEGRLV